MHRVLHTSLFALLVIALAALVGHTLEKQPAATYHARRVALAEKLQGGVAILFAAGEDDKDLDPYRQDEDFYYLTGWNQPGAALMIVSSAKGDASRNYREVLFLPTRNLRMEKYTGVKLDAATPGAAQTAGVDEVLPMAELPVELNKMTGANRALSYNLWTQPDSAQAKALLSWNATTLAMSAAPAAKDVTGPEAELRIVKDEGELALLKKAADASIAAQRVMMQIRRHPGVTERTIAGKILREAAGGRLRAPSLLASIVGAGINSTTLHYSETTATMADGDVVVVDAAGEYSMLRIGYHPHRAGQWPLHRPPARGLRRGAGRAACRCGGFHRRQIDHQRRRAQRPQLARHRGLELHPHHGKGLHGEPLSDYWIHGLGHMVGIYVHDPSGYPAVLRRGWSSPSSPAFTFPKKKSACASKMSSWSAGRQAHRPDRRLPHTADEVESAMKPAI
jgi:Xaa-Pro aminopeptidase